MNKSLGSSGNATEQDYLTPDCVYSAHLRLLAAIIKTAVGDWQQLEEIKDPFCDRNHTIICNKRYFNDGKQELKSFFESEWFERICLELSLNPETVHKLTGIEY